MSTEDLEKYETEMELQLYREYRDIVRQFTYVVETERRFYLANSVDLQGREAGAEVYFHLQLSDGSRWRPSGASASPTPWTCRSAKRAPRSTSSSSSPTPGSGTCTGRRGSCATC